MNSINGLLTWNEGADSLKLMAKGPRLVAQIESKLNIVGIPGLLTEAIAIENPIEIGGERLWWYLRQIKISRR